jgi:hypothetical protein
VGAGAEARTEGWARDQHQAGRLPRRCAAARAGPDDDYIKTSETNRYVTLARDVNLRTLAAGRDAAIPACQ